MNRLKAWLRTVLGLSRGESNAFILLLPLMAMIIFSMSFYRYWGPAPAPRDFSKHQRYLDSLTATWEWEKKQDSVSEKLITFFRFDPNTASQEQLQSLGLSQFMATRIINYRSKGGKFRIRTDLKKVYGIDTLWFKRVLSYIDLPDVKPANSVAVQKPSAFEKKNKVTFDLNEADTSQLIKLYGIGPKLAIRIVKYRDKLGGFVNMSQLKEVYGLDTVVVSRIAEMTFIDRNFVPARLNINQLTEKELAAHPYLNWKIAKAITAYRFQHGSFRSLDDLAHVKLIDEQVLEHIRPYLTLD